MLDSLISLIFVPFTFAPVLYCCGFSFVSALFGLIYSFVRGDFRGVDK